MDEATGAVLGVDQRDAIRGGELSVRPPECSHSECWADADVWVALEHSDDGRHFEIPRCTDHSSTGLPHQKVGSRPTDNTSNQRGYNDE